MIINKSNIVQLGRSFSVVFKAAFDALTGKQFYERVATVVPSTSKQNDYGWLGVMPKMREWLGDRVVKALKIFSYTITNKDYEATIAVDRNDIEDDNLSIYPPMIQALAAAAQSHPDELIFPLFHSGFSTLCYDGQYMFDSDHPVGSSTKSNVGTAGLDATAYAAARSQMMQLTDDEGRPLNVIPDLLVVPPQLEKTALEILRADRLANGASNVYKDSADILVVPALAGHATEWFLLDTKKPLKPFIFQQRKKPQLVSKDRPEDDNVFNNKEFLYGVDSRDNAGYGLWQLAYGSDGTT